MTGAAVAFHLIVMVVFVVLATEHKKDPTFLWFGAAIGLLLLFIDVVRYSAGGA